MEASVRCNLRRMARPREFGESEVVNRALATFWEHAGLLALALAGCRSAANPPATLRGPVPETRPAPAPEAASAPGPARAAAANPASLPWSTGPEVGHGVAFKDTKNPDGENLFIGYAGYEVDLASAEAWVEALHERALAARGVRYLWAVQGPKDILYSSAEIGNSRIAATLLPLVGPKTRFVLVAGHSSGSFVAHELLEGLAGGMDPSGLTAGRIVYFDLDGGGSGLTPRAVGRLRRAYFVGARDAATGTRSPRLATMRLLGATYASAGGYLESDASEAGCRAGAEWCVHDALITTLPHEAQRGGSRLDYADFAGRRPCQSWIDAKADEAGLAP